MKDFKGKTAFITGAASGIGYALARVFAREGMNVVLADIEKAALDAACTELEQAGHSVLGVEVDVADSSSVARARDIALGAYGAVHLVINNAGVNAPGALDEVSYADWQWVLSVNLWGAIHGVHEFLPELKKHGAEAHLINTASVGGLVGMRNLAIYNASKFAVVGLSEGLRADAKKFGFGVSVLCPGIVRTRINSSQRNRPVEDGDASAAAPAHMQPGTDPAELAEQVLTAVKAGEFFICTHPEFAPVLKQRHAAIERSSEGDPSEIMVGIVNRLVPPFEP